MYMESALIISLAFLAIIRAAVIGRQTCLEDVLF